MKQILSLVLLCLCVMLKGMAQEVNMHVWLTDGSVKTISMTSIDSVTFITRKPLPQCPDSHHPHAIDLGLRSGTKWACCNIGATSPEEYGGYYAWGETEEKSSYTLSNYKFYDNGSYLDIGTDICGTEYDVAHVKWGGSWQMPSLDQIKELVDAGTITWTWSDDRYSVTGFYVSSTNGASIFLPGQKSFWSGTFGGEAYDDGMGPYENYAFSLYLNRELGQWIVSKRTVLPSSQLYEGFSVRAVCP